MYKSDKRNTEKYWLLFDNNHYHTINNIRGFLAVKHFCCKCFQCFEHKETFTNHECSLTRDKKIKTKNKDPRTNKDLAHYLQSGFCKGSEEELSFKLALAEDLEKRRLITEKHNHPKYIVFDFETDTHALTHVPNHVEVDILTIDMWLTHEYNKCLNSKKSFTGYGCEDDFCNWLFTKEIIKVQLLLLIMVVDMILNLFLNGV